jgi:hypothetical protein
MATKPISLLDQIELTRKMQTGPTKAQEVIAQSTSAGDTVIQQSAPAPVVPVAQVQQKPVSAMTHEEQVADLRAKMQGGQKPVQQMTHEEQVVDIKRKMSGGQAQSQPQAQQPNLLQSLAQDFTDVAATGIRAVEGIGSMYKATLQDPIGLAKSFWGGEDLKGPAAQTVKQAGEDVYKPVQFKGLGEGQIRKAGTVNEKGQIVPSGETVKSLGSALSIASMVAPMSKVTKTMPLLGKVAVRGAEGSLIGMLGEGGRALRETGDVSKVPERALSGALGGGLAGGALPLAGAGAKLGGRLGGKLATEALGKTTGVGAEAITQAFKNPNVMRFARMAGKNVEQVQDEVLDSAVQGLGKMRSLRGDAYKAALSNIPVGEEVAQILSKVKSKASELLKDLDVRVTSEGLDFSKSTLIEGKNIVEKALDDVANWSDNTVGGMDTLKRRLDSYVSQLNAPGKKEAQRVVLELKSAVRDGLDNNVAGYKEMTGGYREASDLIDEISKTLSLDNPKRRDIAMKKLLSSLRPTNEDRRKLIEELQQTVGKDIIGRISGVQLSPMMPRGLAGAIGTPALGFGAVLNPAMIPNLLLLAATSSPRAVGELSSLLGKIPAIQFKKGFTPEVQQVLKNFVINLSGSIGGNATETKEAP